MSWSPINDSPLVLAHRAVATLVSSPMVTTLVIGAADLALVPCWDASLAKRQLSSVASARHCQEILELSHAIGHFELMYHLFMTIQQKSSLVSEIEEFWHWKNDWQIRRNANAQRFQYVGPSHRGFGRTKHSAKRFRSDPHR